MTTKTNVEIAQRIVDTHSGFDAETDEYLIDPQSANALLAVAANLSAEGLAKLNAMPLTKAALVCWKVIEKTSKKASA